MSTSRRIIKRVFISLTHPPRAAGAALSRLTRPPRAAGAALSRLSPGPPRAAGAALSRSYVERWGRENETGRPFSPSCRRGIILSAQIAHNERSCDILTPQWPPPTAKLFYRLSPRSLRTCHQMCFVISSPGWTMNIFGGSRCRRSRSMCGWRQD